MACQYWNRHLKIWYWKKSQNQSRTKFGPKEVQFYSEFWVLPHTDIQMVLQFKIKDKINFQKKKNSQDHGKWCANKNLNLISTCNKKIAPCTQLPVNYLYLLVFQLFVFDGFFNLLYLWFSDLYLMFFQFVPRARVQKVKLCSSSPHKYCAGVRRWRSRVFMKETIIKKSTFTTAQLQGRVQPKSGKVGSFTEPPRAQ